MHPIEHLRYLARADSTDAVAAAAETARALGSLRGDAATLVVATRRILERHPTVGQMWWICAHLLVAADPAERAWAIADELDDDPTGPALADALPPGSTVLTGGFGWPLVEAFAERDDVRVACLVSDDESQRFARRLTRFGVDVDWVDPPDLASVAAGCDLAVVATTAASDRTVLAGADAAAAAQAAAAAHLPVWLAAGAGTVLPHRYVEAILAAAPGAVTELPLADVARVFNPDGPSAHPATALRTTAPFAPELLRAASVG